MKTFQQFFENAQVERQFLLDFFRDPNDTTSLKIYADWLEDSGSYLGEYIHAKLNGQPALPPHIEEDGYSTQDIVGSRTTYFYLFNRADKKGLYWFLYGKRRTIIFSHVPENSWATEDGKVIPLDEVPTGALKVALITYLRSM